MNERSIGRTARASAGSRDLPKLLVVALLVLFARVDGTAHAQTPYSVEVRNTPLDDALRAFANATGSAVAYDADLTRGLRTTCAVSTADIEVYLACLLRGTGLEFFRRASGTYVIGQSLELPPSFGIIAGEVGDSETGAPIARAHVRVVPARKGTVTLPGGDFALTDVLPGRYAVSVTHLGYYTWTDSVDVVPGSKTQIRALLAPRIFESPPVIVEQSGTLLHPLDEPYRQDVRPAAAAAIPPSATDLTAGLHIQGSSEGDVQLRIDGHPVYLPRQLLGLIGPFSTSAVERIRIHESGFGVEAGSTLGGVLDFEQRLPDRQTLTVSATSLAAEAGAGFIAGGRDLAETRLALTGRTSLLARTQPAELTRTLGSWATTDPFLLFAPVGAYGDATDDAVAGLYDFVSATPQVGFTDLHLAGQHRLPSGDRFQLTAYHGRRDISGDRRRGVNQLDLPTSAPLVSAVAGHEWFTTTVAGGWRSLLGTRTFVSADARLSRYRYEHDYRLAAPVAIRFESFDPSTGDEALFSERSGDGNDLTEYAVSARVDHSRGHHMLSAGLDAVRSESTFRLRLADVESGRVGTVVLPGPDTLRIFVAGQQDLENSASASRATLWISDRFEATRLALEGGVRLTARSRTIYAEPRLRAAWKFSPDLVAAISMGLYRQYVGQFDYSTINAGEVVSSTRIWLPLETGVRPPRSVHAALDADWRVSPTIRLSGSVWLREVSNGLTLNYGLPAQTGVEIDQRALLTRQDAVHRGAEISASHRFGQGVTRLTYRRSSDRLQSDALFGGKTVSAPWSIPHVFLAERRQDWGSFAASAQARLETGMRWALRQTYYDYFGHLGAGHIHDGWDLSDPDAHGIPARFAVDLGLAYRPAAGLLLNVEVENVLDRANQLDSRLVWGDRALRPDARYLPGRTVTFGASLSL